MSGELAILTRIASLPARANGARREPSAARPTSLDAKFRAPQEDSKMRTTVNLDDDLLAKAMKLTGPIDRATLLQESLKALIERESAKRLAKLGGSQPSLKVPPRRRTRGKP
jgi:Arc/MetJ family transcription regulator